MDKNKCKLPGFHALGVVVIGLPMFVIVSYTCHEAMSEAWQKHNFKADFFCFFIFLFWGYFSAKVLIPVFHATKILRKIIDR